MTMRHALGRMAAMTACSWALLSTTLTVEAQEVQAGALKISTPWTRATPGGAKVAGGFMTITNTGMETDRLVGGSLIVAGTFEVHEMRMDKDVMVMRRVETGLEIAPGATVALKPGSYHVMFMDLKSPIALGDPIKGTLVFEKAGTVEISYRVAPIGAQSPDSAKAAPAMGHGAKR